MTQAATRHLEECRSGRLGLYPLVSRLRQFVYSLLAGDEDINDAERLAGDLSMRVVTSRLVSAQQAASTNTLSRCETEVLTQEGHVQGLAHLNAAWVETAMPHTPHRRVSLDLDHSESPVYGAQEGATDHGHCECVGDHPLFCANQSGDCEGAMRRPGNVHSALGWWEVLEPIVACYTRTEVRLDCRADAAFASPEIYDDLEEHGFLYAIRLPSHHALEQEMEGVMCFYNGRGTAEPWMKEGKDALQRTRLSCHRFVANQVRRRFVIPADHLGNFMRRLTRPKVVKERSLRSVQLKLLQTGARLVRHAQRLVFQTAEGAAPRDVWAAVLGRISCLQLVPG